MNSLERCRVLWGLERRQLCKVFCEENKSYFSEPICDGHNVAISNQSKTNSKYLLQ